MIQTKLFSVKRFTLSMTGRNIPLTEEERNSGKYDGTETHKREYTTTEEELEKFPKFVQDAFRIELDETLKSRHGYTRSTLWYVYEIDSQINDFIKECEIDYKQFVDVKYSVASNGAEYDLAEKALLIWDDA